MKEKLGIQLLPCDEMKSMIRGLNFLLRNTKNEIFCFNNKTKKVNRAPIPEADSAGCYSHDRGTLRNRSS